MSQVKVSNEKIEDYDTKIDPEYWEKNGKPLDTKTLSELLEKYLGKKNDEKKSATEEIMSNLKISISIGK